MRNLRTDSAALSGFEHIGRPRRPRLDYRGFFHVDDVVSRLGMIVPRTAFSGSQRQDADAHIPSLSNDLASRDHHITLPAFLHDVAPPQRVSTPLPPFTRDSTPERDVRYGFGGLVDPLGKLRLDMAGLLWDRLHFHSKLLLSVHHKWHFQLLGHCAH